MRGFLNLWMMVAQMVNGSLRRRITLFGPLLFSILLGGLGCSGIPPTEVKSHVAPAFALPCSAYDTCRELAPCADWGFDSCEAFEGLRGIRRKISGSLGRLDFRAQALNIKTGRPVSLWHDVPLIVSDNEQGLVLNAFFEVSRGTHAKAELNKWEPHNPIWQDRNHVPGQDFKRPRYYAWSPAPGNYGALPRTWENVLEPDPFTGFPGDTDPIDVIDVGSAPSPLGFICQVKVIGALGMIDGTDLQTDWKIYVINVRDPHVHEINDISDVSQQIKDEWAIFWRFYKTVRGLKENFFYAPGSPGGFTADAFWIGAKDAREIVNNSAKAYKKLISQCLNRKLDRPYWVPGCLP